MAFPNYPDARWPAATQGLPQYGGNYQQSALKPPKRFNLPNMPRMTLGSGQPPGFIGKVARLPGKAVAKFAGGMTRAGLAPLATIGAAAHTAMQDRDTLAANLGPVGQAILPEYQNDPEMGNLESAARVGAASGLDVLRKTGNILTGGLAEDIGGWLGRTAYDIMNPNEGERLGLTKPTPPATPALPPPPNVAGSSSSMSVTSGPAGGAVSGAGPAQPTTLAGFAAKYGDQLAKTEADYVKPTAEQEANRQTFLATQKAVPMREPRFTRRERAKNPMSGVTMPMLSGNVNLGDLMSYRLGLLSTGQQLIPKVAAAAQRDKAFEKAKDVETLRLKGLELGQADQIAQAKAISNQLDRQTTLQAARIKAEKGTKSPMADALKEIEAEENIMNRMPMGAADLSGMTPQALGMTAMRGGFAPNMVLQAMQQATDEAAMVGDADMDSPEAVSKYNQRVGQILATMDPQRAASMLPRTPQ